MKEPFKRDIEAIRREAHQRIKDGAVVAMEKTDAARIADVLNDVLATEIVCVLRYRNHAFMARGLDSKAVAAEFDEHALQEQAHADSVAGRIIQLGGIPNLNPADLAVRAHSQYEEGETLESMLKEDLVAERIAIQAYSEIIRWLGDDDPATRQLMIDILRVEQEHAEDLSSLLDLRD
jgi:bacterioferritin